MTKSLLGNLATFNTILQLSLPSAQHGDMSTTNKGRVDTNNIMSTLVSGSIAEHASSAYPRQPNHHISDAYDPFLSQPQGRYSPPHGDFAESTAMDNHGYFRTTPVHDALHSRTSPYMTLGGYSGPDPTTYPPRDALQRTPIVEHEFSTRRLSQDSFPTGSPLSQGYADYDVESHQRTADTHKGSTQYHARRRPFNQDEFDGPSQYLPLPLPQQDHSRAQQLLESPVHLDPSEQDEVVRRANDILSECAFHFVAKYQFPIPLEREKPRVRSAADRHWTEWAYLLKRLATKRRIPARVLYDNQIKQLVTTLENSITARSSPSKDQFSTTRIPKDDRYILQLISSGIQVARILMDSLAMQQLDDLYAGTEAVIANRRRK